MTARILDFPDPQPAAVIHTLVLERDQVLGFRGACTGCGWTVHGIDPWMIRAMHATHDLDDDAA